ncbi:hypothetical protein Aduo_005145 [Ancylostoma duodenale]
MSSSANAGFYSAEEMEDRRRMFQEYYRTQISVDSPTSPTPASSESFEVVESVATEEDEIPNRDLDLRAEMENLTAQAQAVENNLNVAQENITSLELEIMDHIRKGLEANVEIALLRAEMDRREKKAKENVELERKLNVGLSRELTSFKRDLDALRRILPVAAGHIRTIELQERQLLEEELILGYLLRQEVEQTLVEILENREVRISVIVEGTNKLRKASLRKSDHALYRAWDEGDMHCWKGDRFLLWNTDAKTRLSKVWFPV